MNLTALPTAVKMRLDTKGERNFQGVGFSLVWTYWAGEPFWYLNNRLTIVLPSGEITSRLAKDRIEDTWYAANQMASNPLTEIYMTEGQGFSLMCVKDLVFEILLEVDLTDSIGFRGKIERRELSRFLNSVSQIIQGREIPPLQVERERPDSGPVQALEWDSLMQIGTVNLGFHHSGTQLKCIANCTEVPDIVGQCFSAPIANWISILERAILQLSLDEHYSLTTTIRLGAVEFEIDRDLEQVKAVICVGPDSYLLVAIQTDKPFLLITESLTELKHKVSQKYGV